MLILNLLFGKRIYITDPVLGKFFSEKKIKQTLPILWTHSRPIFKSKNDTNLQFQGDFSGIYPDIRKEFLHFIDHYEDEYKPFINEKVIEHKDLLSFDNLQYEWEEVYGFREKGTAIIQFIGKETSYHFLIRFALIDGKVRSIFVT